MIRKVLFTFPIWAAAIAATAPFAHAELYIYTDAQGKRIVSDRPLQDKGYRLQHRRGDEQYVGQLLSGRLQGFGAQRQQFYDPYIRSASQAHQLDPALIKAVIRVESDFNPLAVSPKGARGLMQLMPQTAARYNERDLFSPVANINVGTRHLANLLKRYPDDVKLALAAYNAGEHNVDRYQGIPPFRETQDYVRKVLKYRDQYRKGQRSAPSI